MDNRRAPVYLNCLTSGLIGTDLRVENSDGTVPVDVVVNVD